VFLTDSQAKFTYPDGRTEDINANAGTALHMDAYTHLPESTSKTPFEVIAVELKAIGTWMILSREREPFPALFSFACERLRMQSTMPVGSQEILTPWGLLAREWGSGAGAACWGRGTTPAVTSLHCLFAGTSSIQWYGDREREMVSELVLRLHMCILGPA
jgi:hypothetical protein